MDAVGACGHGSLIIEVGACCLLPAARCPLPAPCCPLGVSWQVRVTRGVGGQQWKGGGVVCRCRRLQLWSVYEWRVMGGSIVGGVVFIVADRAVGAGVMCISTGSS